MRRFIAALPGPFKVAPLALSADFVLSSFSHVKNSTGQNQPASLLASAGKRVTFNRSWHAPALLDFTASLCYHFNIY